mmetsp:Transcript_4906/g.18435  ORF Transcript_4906/g.18435 Transcript_4906/m.18435 type:complete len:1011 (-) Transcript_4906:4275-7307(-)
MNSKRSETSCTETDDFALNFEQSSVLRQSINGENASDLRFDEDVESSGSQAASTAGDHAAPSHLLPRPHSTSSFHSNNDSYISSTVYYRDTSVSSDLGSLHESEMLYSHDSNLAAHWKNSNIRALQRMEVKQKRNTTASISRKRKHLGSAPMPKRITVKSLHSDEVNVKDMSAFFQANRKLFLNKGQNSGLAPMRNSTKSPSNTKRSKSPSKKPARNAFSNITQPLTQHINLSTIHPPKNSRVDHYRPQNTFLTDGIASDLIPSLKHDKPPLLRMLEDYIDEQLNELDGNAMEASQDQYIHVFRECFRLMAQHFTTYGDFLQQVSSTYETTYNMLNAYISSHKQKDLPREAQQEEDTKIINTHLYSLHLKQKEMGLVQENENLKDELSQSETRIAQLNKLFDELDTRYKDMKEKTDTLREDTHLVQHSLKDEVENTIIPLKDEVMAAEQTYEDIKRMSERTQQIQKDSVTLKDKLVPEDMYEEELNLQKKNLRDIDEMHQKLKFLRVANRRLRQQIADLKQHTVDHEDMTEKMVILQNAVTPRPQWKDYTSQWPHFEDPWEELSSQETCKWLARYYNDTSTLIEQNKKKIEDNAAQLSFLDSAIGEEDRNHQKYFYGLGNGEDVPSYMRYVGRIIKKKIPKRDCELVLEELWEERKKDIKKCRDNGLPILNFQDFFSEFIKHKYGVLRAVRAEWIYNLTWACERYINDADCELFIRILRGEISEDAYKEQFEVIDKLEEAIIKADKKGSGSLKKTSIMKTVKRFFKAKSAERIKDVKTCLNEFGKGKKIKYEKLFQETRDKTQSQFIETLRDQFLEEAIEYCDEIEAAIRSEDTEDDDFLTLQQVVNAFAKVDPLKPKKELDRFIHSCLCTDQYGSNRVRVIPNGQTSERGAIPDSAFRVYKEAFIQRLRTGKLLKRTTSKAEVEKRQRKGSSLKATSNKRKSSRSPLSSSSTSESILSKVEVLKIPKPPKSSDSSYSMEGLMEEFEKRHEKSTNQLEIEIKIPKPNKNS